MDIINFSCGCSFEAATEEDQVSYFPTTCDKHTVRYEEVVQQLLNEVKEVNK